MKTTLNEAGPFNRIARETITNPHLSLKAKGLLTLILGFPEEWDFSIAGLRPFLQEGRESIMSALRELAENGHVTITVRRSDDGRFRKYDYAFYDLPQTVLPTSAEPTFLTGPSGTTRSTFFSYLNSFSEDCAVLFI